MTPASVEMKEIKMPQEKKNEQINKMSLLLTVLPPRPRLTLRL